MVDSGLERRVHSCGFGDYMLRESMPACLAAGGQMVEAEGEIFPAIAEVARGDVGGRIGKEGGSSGGAELVGDDAEFVPTGREAKDGFDEVFSVCAKDPACAENEVIGTTGGEGIFAFELGLAIDAERVRGVLFAVGGWFCAIENIIGGEVDDECAEFSSFLAEDSGSAGIDGSRQIRLGLGFINRRVSASAQDHIRLGCAHGGADRVGTREVAGIASAGHHIAERSQRALELEAELTVGASDEKAGCFERVRRIDHRVQRIAEGMKRAFVFIVCRAEHEPARGRRKRVRG